MEYGVSSCSNRLFMLFFFFFKRYHQQVRYLVYEKTYEYELNIENSFETFF